MRSLIPGFGSRETSKRDPFSQLHDEVDRLFDSFSRQLPAVHWPFGEAGKLTPSINVSETDKAVEVTAELPGVDEKDIDVTFADNRLTIKAEKRAEKEEKDKTYHLVERSYGSVQRMVSVPYDVDPNKVDASFEKGVLKVMLPKSPQAASRSRKIKIKSA